MWDIIAKPLGWLMYGIYSIVNNYGVALILFTVITRLILLPLTIKQQKNQAIINSLAPKMQKLKKQYGNNKEKYNEEIAKLYSEEHTNPMSGCLPLLIQFPILFGLIEVIYKPLTFILRIDNAFISAATDIMKNGNETLVNITNNSYFSNRPELYIMQAIQKYPGEFSSLDSGIVNKISNFDYSFLGLQLGDQPTLKSILIIIPILSFVINILMTVYNQVHSKKVNPTATSMTGSMNAVLYIMPLFSLWIAFKVPAGVGLYWIISSAVGFLQIFLLNQYFTPERLKVIAETNREKAKSKKKTRKSFYERALEAQQLQQSNLNKKNEQVKNNNKLSKNELKDYERARLNEARRRMAEKYGDVYDESLDDK